MKNKKKESRGDTAGGLTFVGSIMLGIALGLLYGNPGVGVLLGLGVGFILFGIIKAIVKK